MLEIQIYFTDIRVLFCFVLNEVKQVDKLDLLPIDSAWGLTVF